MKTHILVIDDELSMCDFLARYLAQHGFAVTTTPRGADARRLLDGQHYQLVVLDIVLKDCDGLELLSEIKTAHPALPVLMLTGLGYREDILQEARQRGAAGYLSKTLTTTHLLMEIHRLLKQRPPGPGNPRVPLAENRGTH